MQVNKFLLSLKRKLSPRKHLTTTNHGDTDDPAHSPRSVGNSSTTSDNDFVGVDDDFNNNNSNNTSEVMNKMDFWDPERVQQHLSSKQQSQQQKTPPSPRQRRGSGSSGKTMTHSFSNSLSRIAGALSPRGRRSITSTTGSSNVENQGSNYSSNNQNHQQPTTPNTSSTLLPDWMMNNNNKEDETTMNLYNNNNNRKTHLIALPKRSASESGGLDALKYKNQSMELQQDLSIELTIPVNPLPCNNQKEEVQECKASVQCEPHSTRRKGHSLKALTPFSKRGGFHSTTEPSSTSSNEFPLTSNNDSSSSFDAFFEQYAASSIQQQQHSKNNQPTSSVDLSQSTEICNEITSDLNDGNSISNVAGNRKSIGNHELCSTKNFIRKSSKQQLKNSSNKNQDLKASTTSKNRRHSHQGSFDSSSSFSTDTEDMICRFGIVKISFEPLTTNTKFSNNSIPSTSNSSQTQR
ncbi:hypothetical protein C9374_002443 [Naegleria lovaniensis]|uniref:Uncharacterized protein n=1 Tax=Naegleria lovaniensis TaxID=51637 RepID=A0AA88GV38_NAELO|nr:uncharacterized protein C9374_002443 [Naegleria lovaniensis]KAG2386699.1 hypothetical protein C9374_002443 [Naegleria lovaniensis]